MIQVTGKRGNSGIFSSPAIYNGKVYFRAGDGHVHALNTSDFSLAWSLVMLVDPYVQCILKRTDREQESS